MKSQVVWKQNELQDVLTPSALKRDFSYDRIINKRVPVIDLKFCGKSRVKRISCDKQISGKKGNDNNGKKSYEKRRKKRA